MQTVSFSLHKKATSKEPITKRYRAELKNSPWTTLLSNKDLIHPKDYEQFVRDYMEDFINMVYRIRTTKPEHATIELKVMKGKLDYIVYIK